MEAVANAPVPVTADMNIKVPVNLKLQSRRHADTLIFTSIHLMYLIIHFLYRKLKKKLYLKIFSILTFLPVPATANKLDDSIPVAHF